MPLQSHAECSVLSHESKVPVVTALLFSISLGFICFWEHEPWNYSQLASTHQGINLQSWGSLVDQNLIFWGTAIPSTAKALWVVWEVKLQPYFSHLWEVSGWGSVQEPGGRPKAGLAQPGIDLVLASLATCTAWCCAKCLLLPDTEYMHLCAADYFLNVVTHYSHIPVCLRS